MAVRSAVAAPTKAGFEFSQPPSAVPHQRAAYRQDSKEESPGRPQNLMYDRRVYRGNTFAAKVLTPSAQAEAERLEREATDKRKRRVVARRQREDDAARPRTPDAVSGRAHADAQTDEYLEELRDRPIEAEAGVQTDAHLDRPPSPLFVPKPSGVNVATEILPGDLFNFDLEVEPILDVLVGKTLEQGLMEVQEEEELSAIRAHQVEFEHLRAAELARVQRLEADALRRRTEHDERIQQEKERLLRERQVREKVGAVAFARKYVQEVRATVLARLAREGYFYDPVAKEVETTVLPPLVARAAAAAAADHDAARRLVDSVLATALARAAALREAEVARLRAAAEAAERARLAAEAAEAERRAKAAEEAARLQALADAAAAAGDGDGDGDSGDAGDD